MEVTKKEEKDNFKKHRTVPTDQSEENMVSEGNAGDKVSGNSIHVDISDGPTVGNGPPQNTKSEQSSVSASVTEDSPSNCEAKTPTKDNPYAYLDRNDFTSEKFKIEVRGLPKFYGIGELKKLLNEKLKLGSNKVKPPKRGSSWIYVCFRSEEDRLNAIKALHGYTWKNRKLTAEVAKPAPDPLVRKRKLASENKAGDNSNETNVKNSKLTQDEKLKSSTTPFWHVPYDDQIQHKKNYMRKVLTKMGHEIWKGNPALRSWIECQRDKHHGLPCELIDVRRSPVLDGYRNKCEFTIGVNEETGQRAIGFRLSSYVRGSTGVGQVDGLRHIPDRMKQAVKVFEKFIQSSHLDVFNPETHEGYWRQLTARMSVATDQLMLVVGIHPQALSVQELDKLKKEISDFFTSGEGKDCNVSSLYFQRMRKRESAGDVPPLEHLMGDTHIYETLLGLKFRISPEAFFQVNTAAAEVLYSSIAEIADPIGNTTILDVCCGTGTIGLSLAKHCDQVLGLEMMEPAVADAKRNADINDIKNCDFFVGKAEDILSSVVNRATKDDVLAVVDPPRAGLHQKAVIMLRRMDKVKKMIYVSCDPNAAVKNFVDLARPCSKTYYGAPLLPIRAVAVDLFPHTSHCELVMYFERADLVITTSNVSAETQPPDDSGNSNTHSMEITDSVCEDT